MSARLAGALAAAMVVAFCVSHPANAQTDHGGRIEGTVTDSVHARALAGVRVVAAGVGSAVRGDAITNATGAFRIDSLAPGRYMVGFESPLLDSLEIALPPREVTVAPGGAATIALASPSAAKLRAAVCSNAALPQGTGAVYGHVVSAETDNPLPGVTIAIAWQERDVEPETLRPVNRERTASNVTDAAGWYVICGVPTGMWLWMQLQHDERAGPVLRALVDDTLGIAIRHLSFSATGSRPIADSTSTAADSASTSLLTGTATVSGTVFGAGDAPVALAEVRVRGTQGAGRTDSTGRYSLSGLPAGTQELEVRRVGYAVAETSVELRSGATTRRDVRLQRIVSLDSVRVVATRTRYPEFSEHRRMALGGRFLGPEEIQRWRVARTSDIIRSAGGYVIQNRGGRSRVIAPGQGASTRPCVVNVVIDGIGGWREDPDAVSVDDVQPSDIGAIELGSGLPEYNHGCGSILIWTKR